MTAAPSSTPPATAGAGAGAGLGRVTDHLCVSLAVATPDVDERVETTTRERVDRPWDVIVWDDPVNLMSYVVWVFMRVFSFSEPVARKLMLEVHQRGRSLVASEPREQAELYLQQLHGYGLQATIQRSR